MHMKHNRASKTLIRLIDGVFPIFALNNVDKLLRQRKAQLFIPEPPMTTTPPQIHFALRGAAVSCGENGQIEIFRATCPSAVGYVNNIL